MALERHFGAWRRLLRLSWRTILPAAVLCALLGVAAFGLAPRLVLLSYDLLFLFRHETPVEEVMIVHMDEESFKELKQNVTAAWDLNLHARLVDRLTADGAKLVVFDVVFTSPGDHGARSNFVRAVRQNGRVVLAASLDQDSRPQMNARGPVLPLEDILDAAAGWGVAEAHIDSDGRVRQYFAGTQLLPSLPWAAAEQGGAPLPPERNQEERWLNFYGPALTLPGISYAAVELQPAGYFKDKIVFIGALPKTLRAFDEADVLPTPHSRWRGELFPGVELTATAFLNLWRQESFRQWPWLAQWAGLAVIGLLVGGVLSSLRPGPATVWAIVTVIVTVLVALLVAQQKVWFAWTVIAFVEVPAALACSIVVQVTRLKFEKSVAERALAETARLATAIQSSSRAGLTIPDHELIKCIGQGAYGEVWLARNVVGAFHAVKIVKRSAFPSDVPYEREFRGIQKFMPISRSHPGFVHILHVGRHPDQGGYFFYIMEAGDDATSGKEITPELYSPKTLASELSWRGKLAPEECLRVGLVLADALSALHRHQLIHRDIKPANIIYVGGTPKLADIGLVTDMAATGAVSCLGTEGYVPPEGPGTGAADVYGLGKVLYEAAMGRDRLLFPEVPTAVWEEPNNALWKQLNGIIGRACATDLTERYPSAAVLHAALVALQQSSSNTSAP